MLPPRICALHALGCATEGEAAKTEERALVVNCEAFPKVTVVFIYKN